MLLAGLMLPDCAAKVMMYWMGPRLCSSQASASIRKRPRIAIHVTVVTVGLRLSVQVSKVWTHVNVLHCALSLLYGRGYLRCYMTPANLGSYRFYN